jgi:hypothetical protein
MLSVLAVAAPDPDWSRAGLMGLLAYVVVSLAQIWVQRPRVAAHHADCQRRLIDVQAKLDALLERGGHASPLPRNDERD